MPRKRVQVGINTFEKGENVKINNEECPADLFKKRRTDFKQFELDNPSNTKNNNNLEGDACVNEPDFKQGRLAIALHPLMIPHIRENILNKLCGEFLTSKVLTKQLKSYRFVCKSWNEVIVKTIRQISDDLAFGENDKPDTKRMRRFLHDMENSEDIPTQKYRFDPGFFIQKNAELFTHFLYSCGSSIVTLKLWFDNECTLKFPKRCYSDLKLDSLQYLFFGCVNYRGKASTENLELTYALEAFLNAGTNLTKFCFSFPPKDFKSQKVIISRFGHLIGNKVPKTVKNLKIEMKIKDEQLSALAETGLTLDTLHCDFRGSTISRSVLNRLLELQKNSLQEIRLLDSEMKYDFEIEFPKFQKLTVFEIQGGIVLPFSYKDNFPVLERLILFGWHNTETLRTILESSTSCHCLKSLELPYKIADVGLVYLASKCFPNLKKLEISPTAEGMEVLVKVFQCMTGLEELEITFPFVIENELNVDSVFTGIPNEECARILEKGEVESTELGQVQETTSITNLTKLEKLIIQDHSSEIRLTDISANFAFLKLESLKYMEIDRFQMSERFFELLCKKVNVPRTIESDSDLSSFDSGESDVDFSSSSRDSD